MHTVLCREIDSKTGMLTCYFFALTISNGSVYLANMANCKLVSKDKFPKRLQYKCELVGFQHLKELD